jgi:hypothetical protein
MRCHTPSVRILVFRAYIAVLLATVFQMSSAYVIRPQRVLLRVLCLWSSHKLKEILEPMIRNNVSPEWNWMRPCGPDISVLCCSSSNEYLHVFYINMWVDSKGFWQWCVTLRITGFLALCPSSGIVKTREHNVSETESISVLRWGGRHVLCWVP